MRLLPLLLLSSCLGTSRDPGPTVRPSPDDLDGDKYTADVDCDDLDPERSPGKAERCNGVDDDCDTLVDEDDPGLLDALTFYLDADGDGWGDPDAPITGCELGEGEAERAGDCDDGNPLASPGATEDCRQSLDLDCDGWEGCADPDCYEACREDCDNGLDDDQDGYIDCEDRDCLEDCDTGS